MQALVRLGETAFQTSYQDSWVSFPCPSFEALPLASLAEMNVSFWYKLS